MAGAAFLRVQNGWPSKACATSLALAVLLLNKHTTPISNLKPM